MRPTTVQLFLLIALSLLAALLAAEAQPARRPARVGTLSVGARNLGAANR